MERDDLSPPVVPGPPRANAPPESPVQYDTGPSGEWGYGARYLCWARAPSGSATRHTLYSDIRCTQVLCLPTDIHSLFLNKLLRLLLLLLLLFLLLCAPTICCIQPHPHHHHHTHNPRDLSQIVPAAFWSPPASLPPSHRSFTLHPFFPCPLVPGRRERVTQTTVEPLVR